MLDFRRIADKSEPEVTRIIDAQLRSEGWLVRANVGGMLGSVAWPDRIYFAPRRYCLNAQWQNVVILAEWKSQKVNSVTPLQQKVLTDLCLRQHLAVAIYVDVGANGGATLAIRAAGGGRAESGFSIDLLALSEPGQLGDSLVKACWGACSRWWEARSKSGEIAL